MKKNNNLKYKGSALLTVIIVIAVLCAVAAVIMLRQDNLQQAQSIFSDENSDASEKISALDELEGDMASDKIKPSPELEEVISKAIGDSKSDVALRAIEFARKHNLRNTFPAIIHRLTDNKSDMNIREQALNTLGSFDLKIRDSVLSGKLSTLMLDRNLLPDFRQKAITLSEKFWDKNIIEKLFEISLNHNVSRTLRIAALDVIQNKLVIGSPHVQHLFILYTDNDKKVAEKAEAALGKIRKRNNILDIYGYGSVASKAMKGVGDIQAMNARHQQKLLDMMDNMNGGNKKKSPLEKIAEKLKSDDTIIRMEAVYDLGEVGGEKALPILDKLVEIEQKGRVHLMLAKAYKKINSKKALPTLLKLPKKAHPSTQ